MSRPNNIIIPSGSALYQTFHHWTASQRMVFFAGLPGVGKSLLLQQLALLAHHQGCTIYLLQWDVARQPFETHDYVLAHYPEVDGVTHGVVRKAVGIWARQAVGEWHETYPAAGHLLIGEVPLIGNRFMELAHPQADALEAILAGPETIFTTPVPSREIRRLIKGRREASSANPQHEREQADAIPAVMRGLWLEVYRVAHHLGLVAELLNEGHLLYDPDIYRGVYEGVLKHRHSQSLTIDIQFSTNNLSTYDFDIQQRELIPQPDEVRRCIAEVERRYPDKDALAREIEMWFMV